MESYNFILQEREERTLRREGEAMTSSRSPLADVAVMNYVRSSDYEELKGLLGAAGLRIMELDGGNVFDKKTFLEAASKQLLNGLQEHNWSSFEDLLRSEVWSLEAESVALVWTKADRMLDGGLSALITVADIFTNMSRQCYAKNRLFVTFLVGDGTNFPPLNLKATGGDVDPKART